MAEVLPPPMQPSTTMTMLHSRPSSADAFQTQAPPYPQSPRLGQQSRNMYNATHTPAYRATTAASVQPYAFQSTPSLRPDTRSVPPPPAPSTSYATVAAQLRPPRTQSASASSTTSTDASSQPSMKDDSAIGSRDGSLINLSSAIPDLSLISFDQPAKPSPDRYRHRPAQRRTESGHSTLKPSSSGVTSSGQDSQKQPTPPSQESVDDYAMDRTGGPELAKRYRRRSVVHLENTTALESVPSRATPVTEPVVEAAVSTTIRPVSSHERLLGDGSRPMPSRKESDSKPATSLRSEGMTAVSSPPGSAEHHKHVKSPSPLSREAVGASTPVSSSSQKTYVAAAQAGAHATSSPAAQHLAAVSDRDLNKGMKSRLRRAFSFGSAQELRRATAEHHLETAVQSKEQHQHQIDIELDAESQEIARRQEAAGIGAGIYSGQGGFTGSMDNLSVSSTASSASLMLRKMGRGAKKGARGVKGLFRPKSVIGVPAADGPITGARSTVQPTVSAVSMVTVEAERHKVNVTEHPAEKPHGITGFPKLERNSIDAAHGIGQMTGSRRSVDGSDSVSRRSVVGSDRDRAEILAAVKKGILKSSRTISPNASPVIRPHDVVATVSTNSPASSMPSTPKDSQSRHGSMKNASQNDYFSVRPTIRSVNNTPNGSAKAISFSPKTMIYEAWSSSDYDRRGEIATCNRLTPMLAQQIKEELNTFKMEMEVHELSKPHTHFF